MTLWLVSLMASIHCWNPLGKVWIRKKELLGVCLCKMGKWIKWPRFESLVVMMKVLLSVISYHDVRAKDIREKQKLNNWRPQKWKCGRIGYKNNPCLFVVLINLILCPYRILDISLLMISPIAVTSTTTVVRRIKLLVILGFVSLGKPSVHSFVYSPANRYT